MECQEWWVIYSAVIIAQQHASLAAAKWKAAEALRITHTVRLTFGHKCENVEFHFKSWATLPSGDVQSTGLTGALITSSNKVLSNAFNSMNCNDEVWRIIVSRMTPTSRSTTNVWHPKLKTLKPKQSKCWLEWPFNINQNKGKGMLRIYDVKKKINSKQ